MRNAATVDTIFHFQSSWMSRRRHGHSGSTHQRFGHAPRAGTRLHPDADDTGHRNILLGDTPIHGRKDILCHRRACQRSPTTIFFLVRPLTPRCHNCLVTPPTPTRSRRQTFPAYRPYGPSGVSNHNKYDRGAEYASQKRKALSTSMHKNYTKDIKHKSHK